jgi:ketosteroid isomerase-like protein
VTGTETQPNEPIEVIERIYRAFADKDLETVLALTAPDIVVEQDPALPWGGRYHGHDGLGEFVLKLLGAIDSAVTIHEMYAAGDQVVQYGRTAGTVRANGCQFDIPECHIWTVRDGKAITATYLIDSAAMLHALDSPPI